MLEPMPSNMPIDPIQLTRQLVDIESTTYHEAPAAEFLSAFLTAQGYLTELQPVPQPDPAKTPGGGTGPRFNVYATLPGITPDIVFSTHTDTVPPFLGPCSEDENFLYGRGTCDAKGIIAAQIAAAEKLRATGVRVGLLFVAGEERDSAERSSPTPIRAALAFSSTASRPTTASRSPAKAAFASSFERMARWLIPHIPSSASQPSTSCSQRYMMCRRCRCPANPRSVTPRSTSG